MSERWIRSSKKILERIERLERAEDRDRLELVRSTWFMFGVLQRSLVGWLQWVKNPEIMVKFTKEELEEINSNIAKFTRSFIEYDLEVTEQGTKKGLKAKKKKPKEKAEPHYVISLAQMNLEILVEHSEDSSKWIRLMSCRDIPWLL